MFGIQEKLVLMVLLNNFQSVPKKNFNKSVYGFELNGDRVPTSL